MNRPCRRLLSIGLAATIAVGASAQTAAPKHTQVAELSPTCLLPIIPWLNPEAEIIDIDVDDSHVYILFARGVVALDHDFAVTPETLSSAVFGSIAEPFHGAHVGANALGEKHVVDARGSTLVVIEPNSWRQTRFATGIDYPAHVEILRRGGLLLYGDDGLQVLYRRDGLLHPRRLPSRGLLPTAITENAEGQFVLFNAAAQRLQIYRPDGSVVRTVRPDQARTGFTMPHALVALPDGGFVLGDPGIVRFLNSRGRPVGELTLGPDGARLPAYYRLSTDPEGRRLYLLDPRSNRVVRFDLAPQEESTAKSRSARLPLSELQAWCREQEPTAPGRRRMAKARGTLTLAAARAAESLLLMRRAEELYAAASEALKEARRADPIDTDIPSYLEEANTRRGLLRNLFASESDLSLRVEQSGTTPQGVPVLAVVAEAQDPQQAFDLWLAVEGYNDEPVHVPSVTATALRRTLLLSDWIPQLSQPLLRESHTARLQILVTPPGRRLPLSEERHCEIHSVSIVVGGSTSGRWVTETGAE